MADQFAPDQLPVQEPVAADPPAKRAKFLSKFAELDPEADLNEESLGGILTDPEKRDEFTKYVNQLNPEFTMNGQELADALGYGADVKKKLGGDGAGNGSPSTPNGETQQLNPGQMQEALGIRPQDVPQQVFDQEFGLPQATPLGYQMTGAPEPAAELAAQRQGQLYTPGDEYIAAGLPLPSGEELRAQEEARQGAQPEAADVADDGFLATLGKQLSNLPATVENAAGNVVDFFGDMAEMAARAGTLGTPYGTGVATRPEGVASAEELASPLLENKPTDVVGKNLREDAATRITPVSQRAQQSVIENPTNAAAWGNLLGQSANSIVAVGAASALGGPAAGVAAGSALGVSSTKDAARQAGISDKEATIMAAVLAPVQGVLEETGVGFIMKNPAARRVLQSEIIKRALAYGEGKIIKSAVVKAASEILPEVVKKYGGRAITSGLAEAGTEFAQGEAEGAAKLIADAVRDPSQPGYNISVKDALVMGPLEQAAGGFVAGGGFGTGFGGASTNQAVPENGASITIPAATPPVVAAPQPAPAPLPAAPVVAAPAPVVAPAQPASPVAPTPAPVVAAPTPAPATPAKIYAPVQENPSVAERKTTDTSSPTLTVEITPDPADPTKATFTLNPEADQQRIVGDGLSRLQNFFDYNQPIGKISGLATTEAGQMELRDGEWHVTKKAGIQVQDDTPAQVAPTTPSTTEPEPIAPEAAAAPASAPDAVGGEVSAADEAATAPNPEPLPAATPDPAQVKTLTPQQLATNDTLDALDRYNALKPGQKKGKEGSAARAEISRAAKKADIDVTVDKAGKVTLAGGKRLMRSNEYTATTPAANHVPLDARPEDAHAFMEALLFTGDQDNPRELQGLGIKIRGKELSPRELADAVKDIRAGRNTMRAQLVLDTLENGYRQGYLEKSTGTGLATRKFQVPIEDYMGQPDATMEAGERELTDQEWDDALTADPNLAEAVASYTDPTTGEIDYARLAADGGRGALETFFDVPTDIANKVTALANERAQQQADPASPAEQIQRGPVQADEAAALTGSATEGSPQPVEPATASAGPPAAEQGVDLNSSTTPPTLAEQNRAAKAEFAQGLAAFRAARKKGSGIAQSSILGVPAFSAEEAAALAQMAKAAVKLGAVKTKQVIARLRAQGLTDDDVTDDQLRPFIKQLLADEGVRQPKAPKATPQNPTDLANTKERQGAQSIAASGLSDELTQGLIDRGTNLYTPKSITETVAHVDRIIAKEGIDKAYYTASHESAKVPKDVQEVLRIKVMAHYDAEVRRLRADPAANAAEIDEAVERAGQIADVYVTGGTEAGRALRARQVLDQYAPSVAVARLAREVKEAADAQRTAAAPAARRRAKAVRKVKQAALDAALANPAVQATLGQPTAPKAAITKIGADPVGWGSKNKIFTRESAQKAREALRKLGLSTVIPPELIHFLGFHIEAGARSFADVSARAVRDLGQKVRPLLPEAYEQAKKDFIRQGGDNKGFDGPDAVEAALRSELAEDLAERIVLSVKPALPGVFNPVADMLATLTKKVREKLPSSDKTPRAARELLALAINNRREYSAVIEESKRAILKKIDMLKVSDAVKQKMVSDLTDFTDEATGNVYAQQQFYRAVRQAEDAVLEGVAGKSRGDKLNNLAKYSEAAYERVVTAIQDHVTKEVQATDTEALELREAVAAEINQRILARRRAMRAQQGVYEEGQTPAPAAPRAKPTLSERVTDLLALRATNEQVANRLSGDAVRAGLAAEGKRIQQIARDHLNDPTDVGRSLVDAFIQDAGIPAEQAQNYATAIEREFNAQIEAARNKAIDAAYSRKVRTREPRASEDLTDRVRKLYTLSPTDEGRVLGLVADEAGLPELTKADNTKLYQLAQAIADAKGDNAKARAVQQFYLGVKGIRGLTGWEQVKTVMYANMLSGLGTHAKNFGTTGWNAAADLLYNTGWAGAMAGAQVVRTGNLSALKLALGPAKAFFSKGTGGSQAIQMMLTGIRPPGYEGKFDEANSLEVLAQLPAGTPIKVLRKAYANTAKYWMRMLGANDLLFSGAAEQMWAYNIALTEALQEGRTAPTSVIQQAVNERLYNTSVRVEDAYNQAVQELGPPPATGRTLYNAQIRIRTQELMESSRDERLSAQAKTLAAQTAFNGPMQGFLGAVMSGFGKLTEVEGPYGAQPLKGILPFTKIVANVANEVLNYSPVGILRTVRGKTGYGKNAFAHTYTPMERAIVGMKAATFVLMAAYAFYDEDDLTGAGPSDPGQNRAWRERGHKPYTFHGWNYQGIPFFYNALSSVAAMREAQAYDGVDFDNDPVFQKRATAMIASTAQSSFNAIGLASIQDMMNAINDPSHGKNPGERMMRWASRTAGALTSSAVVPAAGLLRSVSRGVQQAKGATKREANGGVSLVTQDAPWLRDDLPKVWDDLGNEVPVGSTLPFAPTPVPRDESGATEKINEFMDKYGLFIPKLNRFQSDLQVLKSRAGGLTPAEQAKMKTMTDKDRSRFILNKLGGEEAMSPEAWGQFYPKRGRLIKEKLLLHLPELEQLAKTDPRRLRKRLNKYYRKATKAAKKGIDFTDPDVKPYGDEE